MWIDFRRPLWFLIDSNLFWLIWIDCRWPWTQCSIRSAGRSTTTSVPWLLWLIHCVLKEFYIFRLVFQCLHWFSICLFIDFGGCLLICRHFDWLQSALDTICYWGNRPLYTCVPWLLWLIYWFWRIFIDFIWSSYIFMEMHRFEGISVDSNRLSVISMDFVFSRWPWMQRSTVATARCITTPAPAAIRTLQCIRTRPLYNSAPRANSRTVARYISHRPAV